MSQLVLQLTQDHTPETACSAETVLAATSEWGLAVLPLSQSYISPGAWDVPIL